MNTGFILLEKQMTSPNDKRAVAYSLSQCPHLSSIVRKKRSRVELWHVAIQIFDHIMTCNILSGDNTSRDSVKMDDGYESKIVRFDAPRVLICDHNE